MSVLDTVIYSPPMTDVEAGALIESVRYSGAVNNIAVDPRAPGSGVRVGLTMRSWIAFRAIYAGFATRNYDRLEPWAVPVPSTWDHWQHSAAPSASWISLSVSGLYYVSDQLPGTLALTSARFGFLAIITPTSASPSCTITMSDASTVTVEIPKNGPSPFIYVHETELLISSSSLTGCTMSTAVLTWPPGVIVPSDPTAWLSGYSIITTTPPTAPVACTQGTGPYSEPIFNDRNSFSPGYQPYSQDAGRAGMPIMYGSLSRDFPPWTVTDSGYIRRQMCGPGMSVAETSSLPGARTYSTGSPVALSTPASAHIYATGSAGGTSTASLYVSELDGTGTSLVATYSISADGMTANALSTTLTAYKQYTVVYGGDMPGYGGTDTGPYLTLDLAPSLGHPLPFSVVASDGTVLPGATAASLIEDIPARTTVAGSLGLTSVAAHHGPLEVTWSGLSRGAYYFSATSGSWSGGFLNGDGVRGPLSTVLVDTGQNIKYEHWANAHAGGSLTLAARSTTATAISAGTTSVSSSSTDYRWYSFTAPAAGSYRFALGGNTSSRSVAMAISTDALCMPADHHLEFIALRVYELDAAARYDVNTPPSAVSYVGVRCYFIGSAPTGAWAGRAGQIAIGSVDTGTINWQYEQPEDGDCLYISSTAARYVRQAGAWVLQSAAVYGSVDIAMANGATLYMRVGNPVATTVVGVLRERPMRSAYDFAGPPACTITITAL